MNPKSVFFGILVALFAASSCQSQENASTEWKRFEVSQRLMGVKFGFVVYGKAIGPVREGIQAAVDRIRELENKMSDYNPESELMQLCQKAVVDRPIKASSDMMEILQLSDRIHKATEGGFDPTLGPLTRLWRTARLNKKVPEEDAIKSALKKVGWKYLELSPKDSTVVFRKSGMSLDLGGIAKGLAADEAIRILKEKGLPSSLVDASGDVTVGDAPPGKKGWTIAVSENSGQRLILSNASVATSGDRYQFLEHQGKRYSHILNPATGWGMTDRRMVTVVCQLKSRSGAMADGWASAFSVMPISKLKAAIPELEISGLQIIDLNKNQRTVLMETGVLKK